MPFHLVPRPLLYVEAVAKHGSIQAASRELGIAASAIDRHIKSLEEANRAPLFERLPRGMRPTAAGEAVVVMVRRWQTDAERLETDLQEMRGQERGSVRLAAMDCLVNGVLQDLHSWKLADHPHIRLNVNILAPIDAARALDEGSVEVAMAFNMPRLRHQHILWNEKLRYGCIVAPEHPLAKREGITLAQASGYSMVSQSAVLPTRQHLDNRHSWFFLENAPVLTSNSLQLLKNALQKEKLAMITSELDVLPELHNGDLVLVPLMDEGLAAPTISVTIDTRRPLSRAARLVAEFLIEQTKEKLSEARETTVKPIDK